jgi:hypothetical protein
MIDAEEPLDAALQHEGITIPRARFFAYQYPDDFPANEQLVIEHARLEANLRLESTLARSYDEYSAAYHAWFWDILSAAAGAIGRSGSVLGWSASRRRELLLDFGFRAAEAVNITSRDGHRFQELCESQQWRALDDRLVINAKSDAEQLERAKRRSDWLNERLTKPNLTSDTDIAASGGPTYNTLRRYRTGKRSTRDRYVRHLIAKVFECDITKVPE